MPLQVVQPQPGPQTMFCANGANVCIYGGEAGGGKTFALTCLEAVRHTPNPNYRGVLFRREATQLFIAEGLWDLAEKQYPGMGAVGRQSPRPEWEFPSGAKIEFAHLNEEKTKYKYQGAGWAFVGFDQLEHFTLTQYSYITSRNRSASGIASYIRGTVNPDPDHFCRRMLDPWIYSKKDGVSEELLGYPNPEMNGVVLYHLMDRNNEFHFSRDGEALRTRHGRKFPPLTLSFIRARLKDNPKMLDKDPLYESKLENLTYVEQMRLQEGNWDVREGAGTIFKKEWFKVIDASPPLVDVVRYWDRASTSAEKAQKRKGSSWTCGMKIGITESGVFVILDIVRFQGDPGEVEMRIGNTASQDGYYVRQVFEQDPGQAGVMEAEYQVKKLAGYQGEVNRVTDPKKVRARGPSAQAKIGNIWIMRADWNPAFLQEAENFDGTQSDADQVDCLSGGFFSLVDPSIVEAGTFGRRR